ncbi:MAG: hypothetical protein Q9165_004696 [Trypethelium subeluteriae]
MAGKRLVDAAKLFNAVSSVAKQHAALRSQQLDIYSRTSTLAKAVKSQTDRITVTAEAAYTLAQRLNETGPNYSSAFSPEVQSTANDKSGLRRDSVAGEEDRTRETSKSVPTDPRILQRQAESQIPSLASGSQPQPPTSRDQDVLHERPRTATPELSSLPRTKLPKHAEDTQGSDSNVQDGQINQDVYYSSEGHQPEQQLPQQEAEPVQEKVPEGINTDVFHSPKISKMLGGQKSDEGQVGMRMEAASRTPLEHPKLAEGKDQDTFNVRTSAAGKLGQSRAAADKEVPELTIEHPDEEAKDLASSMAKDTDGSGAAAEITTEALSGSEQSPYRMHESRVPSTRFGRIWQYSGLATSMAFGAVGESWRRVTGSGVPGGSLMLSEANMERLVAKLSRMRGAALKLGQMMSFQDSKMLSEPINQILQRVQDNADYMPASQRDQVLSKNLGQEWRDLFSSFDDQPIAAASIGQVHKATLKSTNSPVAIKVQYPGVASSISSDLSNFSLLLTASRLLPKGLFLDKTIANARTELAWECDYIREARCASKFVELLSSPSDQEIFTVPKIHIEASGPQVLTADFMSGTAVTKLAPTLTQSQRDRIGTQLLRLCLRELCDFAFMQTDPNWTNFLFNRTTGKLELLDFGAAREYPQQFIAPYIRTLRAASRGDCDQIRELSVELGYLTGRESTAMADAHVNSVLTLAEPFAQNAPEVYDFRDQTVTERVRGFIPTMLRERLAPPPEETYSLHRKLSGAFLLLARLGSRVPCREIFEEAVGAWEGRGGTRTEEAERILGTE